MGWAGQTWMRIIQEGTGGSNYGVYNSGASGGQILFPTIYGGDAFGPRNVPQRQIIRTADAANRRKMVVANRHVFTGRFNTLLHPDQASYWITAATTLTNDAGGHPYLPSYSVEYWDSEQAWRFLGGMIRSITIASSAEQDYTTLSMDWVFQKRDATFTTFTQPAETNYSTLVPYCHVETAGNITLAASALTKYKSVNLTVNNVLAPTWDELTNISALYYCGRDLDYQLNLQYLNVPFPRTDFESQTPLTIVVDWTRASPSHSLSFNIETASYISGVDDSLPLDGPGYQNVALQSFYDASNTADFVVTVS